MAAREQSCRRSQAALRLLLAAFQPFRPCNFAEDVTIERRRPAAEAARCPGLERAARLSACRGTTTLGLRSAARPSLAMPLAVVLGAGVSGLTCAVRLLEAGARPCSRCACSACSERSGWQAGTCTWCPGSGRSRRCRWGRGRFGSFRRCAPRRLARAACLSPPCSTRLSPRRRRSAGARARLRGRRARAADRVTQGAADARRAGGAGAGAQHHRGVPEESALPVPQPRRGAGRGHGACPRAALRVRPGSLASLLQRASWSRAVHDYRRARCSACVGARGGRSRARAPRPDHVPAEAGPGFQTGYSYVAPVVCGRWWRCACGPADTRLAAGGDGCVPGVAGAVRGGGSGRLPRLPR